MKTTLLLTGLLVTAVGFSAYSQDPAKAHGQHAMQQDSVKGGGDMMGAMHKMMQKMQQMRITGNTTVDFATHLKHHHQGAVDMAEVELRKGTDEQMKAKAQEIVTKQKKEIEDLNRIIGTHKSRSQSNSQHGSSSEVLKKGMMTMMETMKMKPHAVSLDHQFASMMIRHHEDGVKMSQVMLEHEKDDELKSMLQKSIEDRKKDIDELTRLLEQHK